MANNSKAKYQHPFQQSHSDRVRSFRAVGDVSCLYQGWSERRLGEETATAFIELHASFSRRAGTAPDSMNALVRAREKLIEGKARARAAAQAEISDDVVSTVPHVEAAIDAKRCLSILAEVVDEQQRELLELLLRGATPQEWEAYERANNIPPNARHFRVHALRKCLREALTRRGMDDVLDALCA